MLELYDYLLWIYFGLWRDPVLIRDLSSQLRNLRHVDRVFQAPVYKLVEVWGQRSSIVFLESLVDSVKGLKTA